MVGGYSQLWAGSNSQKYNNNLLNKHTVPESNQFLILILNFDNSNNNNGLIEVSYIVSYIREQWLYVRCVMCVIINYAL